MTTVNKGTEIAKIICIRNVAPLTTIVRIMLHSLCFICWLCQYLLILYSLLILVIQSSNQTTHLGWQRSHRYMSGICCLSIPMQSMCCQTLKRKQNNKKTPFKVKFLKLCVWYVHRERDRAFFFFFFIMIFTQIEYCLKLELNHCLRHHSASWFSIPLITVIPILWLSPGVSLLL